MQLENISTENQVLKKKLGVFLFDTFVALTSSDMLIN